MMDILYVEDNPNDADIFSRLVRKIDQALTFKVLESGSEAVDYLTGRGRYRGEMYTLPKLILVDLNLNGLSGFDVVQQARSLDRSRFVPIVAFSTSDHPNDVQSAYEAGVNAYIIKPGSYHATGSVIGKLCAFWLESNIRTEYK
ncbi:response regulator [Spirosoma koreense]